MTRDSNNLMRLCALKSTTIMNSIKKIVYALQRNRKVNKKKSINKSATLDQTSNFIMNRNIWIDHEIPNVSITFRKGKIWTKHIRVWPNESIMHQSSLAPTSIKSVATKKNQRFLRLSSIRRIRGVINNKNCVAHIFR